MDINYDVLTFIFGWARVAIFVDIIKILSMFNKAIFKDSKKVERIRNHLSKHNPYLCFLV